MLLIVVCTILIITVLLYGQQRKEIIEYENGEFRVASSKGTLFLFVAILVIVSTLRYGFIDTYAYKEMYQNVNHNWAYIFTGAGWDIEKGWLFILYLLNYISPSPKLMLFLSALIINVAYAKICNRYSEEVITSLFIFYCLMYLDTNNGLRQMVAMSIIMLAFPFLEERRYILYLICVFLAYQIHNSAIVCLVIMFVCIGKAFNFRMKIVFLASLLFVLVPGNVTGYLDSLFVDSQYNYYLDMIGGMNIARALATGVVPLVVAIWYLKQYGNKNDDSEKLLINITIVNSVFVLMGTYMQYWNRLAFYTFFAPIVMLPKMLRKILGDFQYYRLVKPIMLILYFVFFSYNIYSNYNGGSLDKFYVEWWC